MSDRFDLIVLGGGSGGIANARRAAAHGARVALIEDGRLGGTCVNVGCVPKKVMWHAAGLAQAFRDAPGYGFQATAPSLDWATLVTRREAYIRRLNGTYARNLDKDGVEHIAGRGELTGQNALRVGDRSLQAGHIVVATGGLPRWPRIPGSAFGIDSDGFFALEEMPRRVAIAGSGYIAVELAGLLQALGCEVTLLLRTDRILKAFDPMLGATLLEQMTEAGVRVRTNTQVAELQQAGDGVQALFEGGESAGFDRLIWGIGRDPNVHGIGLERLNVALAGSGHIDVDAFQNTNVEGIYALGDVTGQAELTPVAIAAGRRLSDRLFGGQPERHLEYHNIPTVVFSHPPIGSVGLSADQARRVHGDDALRVYDSSFVNLYYGVLDRKPKSRMKLVCVGDDRRVVGVHVIGDGADEMLQGFAVALRMGATKRDFDDTVAIHPTSAEEMVTMK